MHAARGPADQRDRAGPGPPGAWCGSIARDSRIRARQRPASFAPDRSLGYLRSSMGFRLHAPYPPAGDQPQAIAELVAGLRAGQRHQTLLGVTGSGKTFSIANVLAE